MICERETGKRIYTIGYSAFDIDSFICALKDYGVNCLIDVRSVPSSSYFPEYNEKALKSRLEIEHILYRHYPEFGARQPARQYYSKDGYLDFDLYLKSNRFLGGIERVLAGMRMNYCFSLMCAEKDPVNCHRAIMVARGFEEAGCTVQHIRIDGEEKLFLEGQRELERRLMKKQGDDPDQVSMLDNMEERIARAYYKQNALIGFRINDN